MSTQSFEFIAGSPSLCFVDTYGDRGGAGRERLVDRHALAEWLEAAGLHPLQKHIEVSQRQLIEARRLREAIHRACIRIMAGDPPARADIAQINRAARHSPLRPQWRAGTLVQTAEAPVDAALSVLAADALTLLASPLAKRIRQCPGCQMTFVDTSRPGRRRWCSSAHGCGNRAKVRNLRARRALGHAEEPKP